jgi:tRNA A37 N6-isopentenylltransferase MiaA
VAAATSERGLRPVVLNADSRQVYAGLDVGTSKIKPAEMRGFEHRLLDVADPSSKLSLEAYTQLARDELAALAASDDALPILVGGTELDRADLVAARAEALAHIRAYSRRQRSWFRKLGAARADHRPAAKAIVSRLA